MTKIMRGQKYRFAEMEMVPSTGVEPVTYRLGGDCSILLSYEGRLRIVTTNTLDVTAAETTRNHYVR
jgi:hypothetical protein